jgi:2-succinyl-5-enolpyruvyl-6-hydroxy-3-cyclohexene-1-carboxylate synthase
LIRCQAFVEKHVPEVVLRIGESPSSKVLNQYVTKSRAFQVHVSAFENTFDADSQVSMHISCDPTTFCRGISRLIKATSDPNHLSQWVSADQKARAIIAKEFASSKNALSAPQVAFISRSSLSKGDNLFVSSSMPVRDLEWFGGDCSLLHVFSNRGANGIDGVIASAIGVAIATRKKTLVLLGDVAFLHDSSSLTALADRDVDLKESFIIFRKLKLFRNKYSKSCLARPTRQILSRWRKRIGWQLSIATRSNNYRSLYRRLEAV